MDMVRFMMVQYDILAASQLNSKICPSGQSNNVKKGHNLVAGWRWWIIPE